MVKPALRRCWRDRASVQFGIGPGRAAVLEGVDRETERVLALLDGTRSLERVRAEAARLGVGEGRVTGLLAVLRKGGVLDDAKAVAPLREMPQAAFERLRPDLASLSVVHPAPGAGAARLAARRSAAVQVRGAGRVGASVAALLAAAGVGTVEVADSGRVEPWDVSPSGIPAADIGRRRAPAAASAVRKAAPCRPAGPSAERGFDLVVFAPRQGLDAFAPDPAEAAALVRAGIAHLYAGVLEETGFIGPLFAPSAGEGACAGCLELGRTEADPAWRRMTAQLRSGRPGPLPACDTALASTVAGLAALHALMFLDGGVPSSLGARVEISLSDTSIVVRPVPRHPGCECACGLPHGRAPIGHASAAPGDAQVTMMTG